MKFRIILKLTIIIFTFTFVRLSAQVESTTTGGPWSSPGTWKDGVPPSPGDDVLIKGPVTIDAVTFARSVQITQTGSLRPEVIQSYTYKLYIANYLWNNGKITGYNFDIYIGGKLAGSIYNMANGYWNAGTLYVVDTLSHAVLSEGKWFSPAAIRADSATLVSAGNVQLDSTVLYARKFILGQNLQMEKMLLTHHSVLKVENFVNIDTDTSGVEFRDDSYIGGAPASGAATKYYDVILKGNAGINANIYFYGNTFVKGSIFPRFSSSPLITSAGLFRNDGEVKANNAGYLLNFEIWGDLINNGSWTSGSISMLGTGNHIVLTAPNNLFYPSNFSALTSTVTVTSTSSISRGNKNINVIASLRFDKSRVRIMKLVLQSVSNLYLVSGSSLAVKQLVGNGNEVKFINNSYLSGYSSLGANNLENVILSGNVGVNGTQYFSGNVYLRGVMYPQFSSYPTIYSEGLFENDGEVKANNSGYLFYFNLRGNLINNGNWKTYEANFRGNSIYYVAMDTSKTFSAGMLYSDSSTVISKSSLRFDNSRVRIKKLVLQNKDGLTLNNSNFSGNITGNGNEVRFNTNSYLSGYSLFGANSLENVILSGNVGVNGTQYFSGSVYLRGVMYPQFSSYPTIYSEGLFQNNGKVKTNKNGYTFYFEIKGDVENNGYWNSFVSLKSDTAQHIGLADTASFPEIKITSDKNGSSYQWNLNGNPLQNGTDIFGATTSLITIKNFDSKYFGTINCTIDSAGKLIKSRDIVVNDVITEVRNNHQKGKKKKEKVENKIPEKFSLAQNYPNPFNPATTIEYSLPVNSEKQNPDYEQVQLAIYDVLGRLVKTIVDQKQKAGYYKVVFNAANLPSGIYFYTLRFGKVVKTKKMLLLK